MHLTPDAMMTSLQRALEPLVAEAGGVLAVAADPEDALGMLAVAPLRWRLVLVFAGHGDHPEARAGVATAKLACIVQRAKGLPVNNGADATDARGTLPGLLALVSTVSQWVRAVSFPADCNVDVAGFAQTGSNALVLDNPATRQHQIDFAITLALPPYQVAGRSQRIYATIS